MTAANRGWLSMWLALLLAPVGLLAQTPPPLPQVTVPADTEAPAGQDVPLGFAIDEPTVGTQDVRVWLYATHGTIKLKTAAGLWSPLGHGDGTASVIVSGGLDKVKAALDGAVFTPWAKYIGPARVFFSYADLGHGGFGFWTYTTTVRYHLTSNGLALTLWGDNSDKQCTAPSGLNGCDAAIGGGNHTLARKVDGTVLAWGNNWYGQCNVPSGLLAFDLAAGAFHSLAIRNDGGARVVAWGYNAYGQCNVPAGLNNVVQVAASYWHNLALRRDGTVVAWGYNTRGECDVPAGLQRVVAVACGERFSVALTADGNVVCWGENGLRQCAAPVLTDGVALATGYQHSLALRSNGRVVAWGADYSAQSEVPASVVNPVEIAAGGNHSLALLANGTVLQWGANNAGQTSGPSAIQNAAGIDAGGSHSLALGLPGPPRIIVPPVQTINGGTTLTFSNVGRNPVYVIAPAVGTKDVQLNLFCSDGTLKLASTKGVTFTDKYLGTGAILSFHGSVQAVNAAMDGMTYTPRARFGGMGSFQGTVDDLGNSGSQAQHDTDSTRIVVRSGGHQGLLWGVGFNDYTDPVVPASMATAVMAACGAGNQDALALMSDGTVKSSDATAVIPAEATGLVTLASSYAYAIGLKADGSIVAWQLATGKLVTIPAAATESVSVGATDDTLLAVLRKGTFVEWRADGTVLPHANIDKVAYVAAGGIASLLLKDDGTVLNWSGVAPPTTYDHIVAAATSGDHSLVLNADGEVKAWGANDRGQTDVPAGLPRVDAISCGAAHSLLILSDGTLSAFGCNLATEGTPALGLSAVTSIAGGSHFTLALGDYTKVPPPVINLSRGPAATGGSPAHPLVTLARPTGAQPAAAAESVTLLVSPVSPQAVDTQVTLTAVGAPAGSEYQFVVSTYSPQTRKWVPQVVRAFDPSNTCVWTPAAQGEYGLAVNTRRAGSSASFQATAAVRFAVKPSPGK